MRKSFNSADWLVDKEELVGINLGFDFCAEHECGIKLLKQIFGVPEMTRKLMGVEAHQSTIAPKDLIELVEEKDIAFILFNALYADKKKIANGELRLYGDATLATAWDQKSFGILVKGEENVTKLKTLHAAILNKDICFGLSFDGNPFSNGGLTLLIASKIPQEFKTKQLEADKDYFAREDEAVRIGLDEVKAKLNAAKKSWFFIGDPHWIRKENTSRGKVMFWLNPMEQQSNNFGWFTIEDLEAWAENKGPIPKKN